MTNSTLPPRKYIIADIGFIILITILALAVHGFHYGIEDEAIYLPAIKKYLDPSLYPFDSVFFVPQNNLTLLPVLVGSLAQVTFLPVHWAVFIAHLLSLFLVLAACWRLSRKCFDDPKAQWAAVMMVAALLTLPIAGHRRHSLEFIGVIGDALLQGRGRIPCRLLDTSDNGGARRRVCGIPFVAVRQTITGILPHSPVTAAPALRLEGAVRRLA